MSFYLDLIHNLRSLTVTNGPAFNIEMKKWKESIELKLKRTSLIPISLMGVFFSNLLNLFDISINVIKTIIDLIYIKLLQVKYR